ncbi:hypothetical protein EVAR_22617_1 [Eumeta japonica]|uniref:Uncharacterized protein n=1 Tax=Eumeta variegata TaxID=151549 RepID=A0A4C1U7M5_EUMVA|nr:hypothetical protein EVAR_22617_1 [Eumeta japonica]
MFDNQEIEHVDDVTSLFNPHAMIIATSKRKVNILKTVITPVCRILPLWSDSPFRVDDIENPWKKNELLNIWGLVLKLCLPCPWIFVTPEESSVRCPALHRNRISDGERSGLMEKRGTISDKAVVNLGFLSKGRPTLPSSRVRQLNGLTSAPRPEKIG